MDKKKIHYGWLICAAGFLQMFLTVGLTSNTFASYQPYLISVVGLSNTQASLLGTIRCLSGIASLTVIAPFYKKLNLRLGLLVTGLLSVLTYLLYSLARGFGMCVAAAVVSGLGNSMGGSVAVSLLMSRWFADRFGLAMGICAAGSGLSSTVAAPLIAKTIQYHSLAAAFRGQAVCMTLITASIFLLVRNSPEDMGLKPYTEEAHRKQNTEFFAPVGLDRAGLFMVLTAIFLFGASTVGSSHLSVLYTSVGMSGAAVAGMLAVGGFVLTGSKMLFGVIADKAGVKASVILFFSLFFSGLLIDCFAERASVLQMDAAAVILNLGLPISSVGLTMLAKVLSDRESYTANLNRFQAALQAGSMVFGIVPGIIADVSGSYLPAYFLFSAMTALSLSGVLLAFRRQKSLLARKTKVQV